MKLLTILLIAVLLAACTSKHELVPHSFTVEPSKNFSGSFQISNIGNVKGNFTSDEPVTIYVGGVVNGKQYIHFTAQDVNSAQISTQLIDKEGFITFINNGKKPAHIMAEIYLEE